MPSAPSHPCSRPHCGRLTTQRGMCRRCSRASDLLRGGAAARGYDREWGELSRWWLGRYPWCGQRSDGTLYADQSRCAARGARVRAEVTDHIVALRDGGARLDRDNLQSLCRGCNAAKDAPRGPRGGE